MWKYWRDIQRPSGKGIEAPVKRDSAEIETKDLCRGHAHWAIQEDEILYMDHCSNCAPCQWRDSWPVEQWDRISLSDSTKVLPPEQHFLPDSPTKAWLATLVCPLLCTHFPKQMDPHHLLSDHNLIKDFILNWSHPNLTNNLSGFWPL